MTDVVFVWMKLNGLDVVEFVETPAVAVTATVKLVDCPFVRDANIGHVTTPFEYVPPPDALENTKFVGKRFVTSVLSAVEGPALLSPREPRSYLCAPGASPFAGKIRWFLGSYLVTGMGSGWFPNTFASMKHLRAGFFAIADA